MARRSRTKKEWTREIVVIACGLAGGAAGGYIGLRWSGIWPPLASIGEVFDGIIGAVVGYVALAGPAWWLVGRLVPDPPGGDAVR